MIGQALGAKVLEEPGRDDDGQRSWYRGAFGGCLYRRVLYQGTGPVGARTTETISYDLGDPDVKSGQHRPVSAHHRDCPVNRGDQVRYQAHLVQPGSGEGEFDALIRIRHEVQAVQALGLLNAS